MKTIDQQELKQEIQHIMDSGVNEIRLFEMMKMFFDRRVEPLNKRITFLQGMVDNGLGKEDLINDKIIVVLLH